MNLAIVSTTISGEAGYLSFDRLAAENSEFTVKFYIAGDIGAADFNTDRFLCDVEYLSAEDQQQFRCSEAIGWQKIMRRNIALLRCLKDRPDCVLMIDDDNEPPPDYFEQWAGVVKKSSRKQLVHDKTGADRWFNYLVTSDAPVEIYPRGFPISKRGSCATSIKPVDAIPAEDIWLYQGISLGDPDIDAMTRISVAPQISSVSEFDYVVQDVWSPYNTQNTLFRSELYPIAMVWPHCGRYDDIFASFLWQQWVFQNDKYVHVGQALNRQIKRPRNLCKDLSAEVEGYLHSDEVIQAIQSIQGDTVTDLMQALLNVSGVDLIDRQKPFIRSYAEDLTSVI